MNDQNKKLLAEQRHQAILAQLSEAGFVTVLDLSQRFHVSDMTIRRDLDFLAEEGKLLRAHGGATVLKASDKVDLVEPDIYARADINPVEKNQIAQAAVKYAVNKTFVALDIGTTNLSLANFLKDQPLRILCGSIKIADQLSGGRVQLYIPGGEVRGHEPSIVGAQAIEQINNFHFDTFFLGASSLSTDGVFDYSLEDTAVKKAIIEKSETVIALIDSSKFGRKSVARVAELGKIDILITDKMPEDDLLNALKEAGVKVEIAAD